MAHGGVPASGVLYGGVDGPLFHGGNLMSTLSAAPPSLDSMGAAPSVAAQDPPPPKFYKLKFATYDGSVDPLNWLNQCDQFFRGQRTLASDRTWLASYHLQGGAPDLVLRSRAGRGHAAVGTLQGSLQSLFWTRDSWLPAG
jgi:hypothetical protein